MKQLDGALPQCSDQFRDEARFRHWTGDRERARGSERQEEGGTFSSIAYSFTLAPLAYIAARCQVWLINGDRWLTSCESQAIVTWKLVRRPRAVKQTEVVREEGGGINIENFRLSPLDAGRGAPSSFEDYVESIARWGRELSNRDGTEINSIEQGPTNTGVSLDRDSH